MRSRVAITHNQDIERAIFNSLNLLLNLSELFDDKHVAIKPNDTWATRDDLTACTQADTVKAVIRYIKHYNPKKITISGGAGAGDTFEIFNYLGINKVIQDEGIAFFDHNKPPFESVNLEYGPQKEIMVNPEIFHYDTVISLAQHKVHSTAGVSLTMKNIAMSYPGADYYGHPRTGQTHPHNFFKDLPGFIVGMCQKFPIHLGIIVGHPAMIGIGPVGGTTFESELVIASRDCIAADCVGARLLGFDEVAYIKEAERMGLGSANINDLEIVGMPVLDAISFFNEKANNAERRAA
ncbi:MAG: hypothetical protein DKM50_00740 [Candidatus Margulisiibacteriota bacterium]|nr:MAG: hypothetical protein A2X43_08875 [Candidatus Margulisbacteria bacterium GWD2_39_127]OGI01461.1 MAG: hypothetical protein A2X42_09850 [Candidatus Margulisbacteria bacterium GWF2_38_17]OGI10718.1 MAG: hypothetical protein A2X41_06335 [Candidatus Margulisbacteria bacterium GWE2_39_32]PZM83977.1 MAG: hypothetical protein DKM50_00740 [Candidatus Margulisiibacteriota bacterium]HAR63276.1 hypothetical protein [Candidatus Margulisiibacteriota bacterium]